jgi:CheY-like chemotaxis protein
MEPAKPTILLIDDEEAIRMAMQRWLTRRGWNVVIASNGQDALEMLEAPDAESRYDAILCDLRMPGISGVQLHNWLNEARPALHARLILATGDVASGEIARFLAAVTCPILEKPFDFALLSSALDTVRFRTAQLSEASRPDDSPQTHRP